MRDSDRKLSNRVRLQSALQFGSTIAQNALFLLNTAAYQRS